MSKQILVNASSYETRVATLENGEIRQLHIEREEDRNVVGNIYKGLVKRVLPGMQAAFLELGLERTAFLYVDDIIEEPFGTDIDYIDEEEGDSDSDSSEDLGDESLEEDESADGVDAPGEKDEKEDKEETEGEIDEPLPEGTKEARAPRDPGKPGGGHDDDGEPPPSDRDRDREPPHRGGRERNFDRDRGPEPQGRDQDRDQGAGQDYGGRDRDRDFDDRGDNRDLDRDRPPRESSRDSGRERSRDFAREPARDADRDSRDVPRESSRDSQGPEERPRYRNDRDRGGRPAQRSARGGGGGGRGGDRDRGGRDRGGRPPGRAPSRGAPRGGPRGRRFPNRRPRGSVNIQDVLKEGQEILVQVAKAPIGTKGARLTTHISLPGRNLVLMPTVKHLGISRRIESDRERRRLRDLFVKKIRPKEMGFIIRTVAEGKSLRDLKADADYLIDLWDKVKNDSNRKRAPALIHEDLSLSMRAVRDFFTDEVDSFVIDDPEEFERIQDFIGRFMPRLKGRVKLFRGPSQLFEHYGIEAEISRALGKKVWLKSGGYLLIDQSEALTAVDVNTGRYVGSKSLEETILKTNLEAVKEISYQLRVRNVGGIIIIDLIDMEQPENREKVFRALQEALVEDKAKTNILKISDLGLVEMTRKRTHEDLVRYLTEACGYCEGRGYHKSKRTVCFEIFREIEKEALSSMPNIVVFANSQVVGRMTKEEKDHVKKLEERFTKTIHIKIDPAFHVEQFEVFGKA